MQNIERTGSDQQSCLIPAEDGVSFDIGRPASTDNNNLESFSSNAGAPNQYIWALTFAAGVSGLLFGYDTGVISSTLVNIGTDLSGRELLTLDRSLVTASTAFFALIASPLAALLADKIGRKKVILLASLFFLLGALLQAWASTVEAMIAGRSVVGLAVGAASFVVPLYVSELSPSAFRGRLVTISALFITSGQVIAYMVGWLLSSHDGGWRWMVGLGALPAIFQVSCLAFMPESPRWLVKAEQPEKALAILKMIYGEGASAERIAYKIIKDIKREILEEDGTTAIDQSNTAFERFNARITQLISIGSNYRALVIACMLQGSQQLCGFNSLMYYSATIFAMLGFRSPSLAALSVAITNFLFTLVAFATIDRIGRRRILLLSIPLMILGLSVAAASFSKIDLSDEVGEGQMKPKESYGKWPITILVAMVIYVAGYAMGLGCVPWQQSELFALPVRSLGSGLATATNWGANFVVGLTFLPMLLLLSPSITFALYALICVGTWLAIWSIYPETAGLSLEDVSIIKRKLSLSLVGSYYQYS